MVSRAIDLIAALGMQPHPEGGHYVEIHRAAGRVQPRDARGERSALTSRPDAFQGPTLSCDSEESPLDVAEN